MTTNDNFIPHQQLLSMVVKRIRDEILRGQYKPGEWLRQQRIAEDLGVSQTPVREAIKQLAAEGLVEHIPYRGARVIEITVDDVVDLYTLREFLESRAASEAAKRITANELTALRKIHLQMERIPPQEHNRDYRPLNRKFHELIYRASQRTYLIRMLDQVWSIFPTILWSNFVQTAVTPLPNRESTDFQEHAAILNALTTHDADKAAHLMQQHISLAAEELINALQKVEILH